MKLHEIIEAHDIPGAVINLAYIEPYKRSLNTYFADYYCSKELFVMVTDVFLTGGLGRIVSADKFTEDLEAHLEAWDVLEEDKPHHRDIIFFNSIPLSEF